MASGKRDDEGDAGEQRVVGQHHDRDDQHQRGVAHPGHPAPLEELGERLDVARDPGDQTAASFLAVIGEAQRVDVADEPLTEVVQRPLAANAEPDRRLTECDAGDEHRHEPDRSEPGDQRDVDGVLAVRHGDAPVDRLLNQDRYDDAPSRPDRGQQEREPEPAPQHRRLAQPTPNRGDRRLVRVEARREAGRHGAPARSTSNASTMSR